MNIGQAASASGLSAKMIRYYESTGLLRGSKRSSAGYRIYDETDINEMRFIRRSRELGFSLKQTMSLLALWRDKNRASADVQRLAQEHIQELEAKAAGLQQMADSLRHLVKGCRADHRPDCPILEGLMEGTLLRAADEKAPSTAGTTQSRCCG